MEGKKTNRNNLSFFIGVPALLWQTLFLFIPLAMVLFLSVAVFSSRGALVGFSLQTFKSFFAWVYLDVIVRSLSLALSNGLFCLMIAYPLAYFIAFRSKKLKTLLFFLLLVPFWTNFLLHVFSWYFIFENHGVVNTLLLNIGVIARPLRLLNRPLAVMTMMVYSYLPFMVLPLYSSLEKIDRRLIEASQDLGATWRQTLSRVIVPLSFPGLLSGFFLVFVASFGEFVIPELLGGDKVLFVGNVLSHYVLGATTRSLGATFTVLSCAVLLCVALLILWGANRWLKSYTKVI